MDAHDANELNPAGSPGELAALARRVANLERVVMLLQQQAPLAQPPLQGLAPAGPAPPPFPQPIPQPIPQPVPPPVPPQEVRFTGPVTYPGSSPAKAQAKTPANTPPRPTKSLEDRLGSQIFPLVGVFALVCGAAYFLKLAIDHGWVGPVARCLIGLLAGAGIVVWSETFRRKKLLAFSYALKAIGTATLYLSLWAAFQLYHLLPAPVALAAMILVTAWNAWMAVSQDAELLAGYALAGGLLTPVLLSSGGNHETFLFTYLAAIAAGVVYLLRTKAWRWLLIPTFLGVVGFFIGWSSEFFHRGLAVESWNGESTETAFFAFLFFALFALPTIKGWSTLPEPDQKSPAALVSVLLPLANSTFLALALFANVDASGLHSGRAYLMVALAALFLGVMRLQQAAMASAMYLATAVVCLTVAVPLKASGHSLTTAWLVEGLILYWAGTRFSSGAGSETNTPGEPGKAPAVVLWILSLGGYLLGLGSLVAHWGISLLFDRQASFFSSNLAAALVAIVTLGGAAWLAWRRGQSSMAVLPLAGIDAVAVLLTLREIVSWHTYSPHPAFANADFATALVGLAAVAGTCYAAYRIAQGRSVVAAFDFILGNVLAILIFVREIGALFTSSEADLERSLAISAFLMMYGAALLAIGFLKRSAFVRWQALVLLIFTVGKVFLYDISGLSAGYRVASFMGLGAVLMGVSYAYQKDWLGLKTPPPPPHEEVQP